MADLADIATEIIEQTVQQTLDAAQHFDAPSNFECIECGEEIPEQRRKLGGVKRCFGCQSDLEAKQKHMK